MKTLKGLNLEGKRVLLRCDLNSDVVNGRVLEGERIKEAALTIKYLKKKKARTVILAHQGNKGKNDFLGLEQHTKILNKYVKVNFVKDVIGKKAISEIENLKDGGVILLNNVRFVSDEFEPEKKNNLLVKNLAPLFDYYVNDAFSVCHRNHTSIVGFPPVMKSAIGLLVEKELNALKKISTKNCLFILGGAKPETNIKLLKGNKVLACGFFGQLCLVAKGKNLGYQNDFLKKETLVKEDYNKFLSKLRSKLKNVETPIDFAVRLNNKRKEYDLSEFPLNYQIDDIGEKTIKKYVSEIKKAKAIYMKGPAGFASDPVFSKGTVAILRAASRCSGYTLVGGGHLSDAISKYEINKKRFDHISLSGGALLDYVAGERLVGLEVLGWYKKRK